MEASKKRNHKKKESAPLTTLFDSSVGLGREIPVRHHSGPRPELEKTKDNKASIGETSSTVEGSISEIVPCADSGNDTESGDVVGVEFREAVEGEHFGWLEANWLSWIYRKDLLDYVITKGVVVTVRLIQNVENAKRCALAALFDKGEERMIDGVLGRIDYDDGDLRGLTIYRPELAGSPEKFSRVLDKIEEPGMQESAVRWDVIHLFKAGRHDLVVPLVNALGERTFKSGRLEDEAIQMAFREGAETGYQDIVGLYCEHPAITSVVYASGLFWSWNYGKPNQVFPFLLEQANQGDLQKAKEKCEYKNNPGFRHAIDKVLVTAQPAGSRHQCFFERAIAITTRAMDALDILAPYLAGEEEEAAGETSRGIATEQEGTAEVGSERTD